MDLVATTCVLRIQIFESTFLLLQTGIEKQYTNMQPFLTKNFLLQTETACSLYHEHAAHLPIIDYHCHLNPKMVAENKRFDNIAQIWLDGDHYKWRAMRSNGINEKYCTGHDASDKERFLEWAKTVPYTFRNPLYHWTHLELKTAFGINTPLNPENAEEIYEHCNQMIAQDARFTPRGMMEHYHVEVVCTTDDPADSLEWHKVAMSDPTFHTKMLPTWRPDAAMQIDSSTFTPYIHRLSEVTNRDIRTFDDLLDALQERHTYFEQMGCRLSDHGIEEFYDEPYTSAEINVIFQKKLLGEKLNEHEVRQYKHAFLYTQALMDYAAGWTQQYHYGVIRNNNTAMFQRVGADTGFDSIGEFNTAKALAHFLDELNQEGHLTQTIIYNLNPCANEVIATMIGNFQDGSTPGKIQYGAGWWFLDQKDGMEKQMTALSNLGLLSRFVGMLTDSRSFLSYPRHEYFRRILCNLLGNDVENGLIPYVGYEKQRLEQMVEDICYYNAKQYFKF